MTHFAEWVAGVGPEVANHLWQSTAFAAAAWLLTLVLRRNHARVRYAVWLAASIKFLVPFSLLIAAGNLLPHPQRAVAPVVYSAMDVVEEPFGPIDFVAAEPVVHVPTLRERVEAAMPVALFALWALGAGLVMVRWGGGWRIARRVLRDAAAVHEGREWEVLRRVEGAAGAKTQANAQNEQRQLQGSFAALRMTTTATATAEAKAEAKASHPSRSEGWATRLWRADVGGVELRLSAERMEPGMFGVWRPVLVWPRELTARLEDAHIETIMAHELAHVRRRDNLTAALHMLVEALFWFHPVVWWMERRMVAEREQACDEAVVAMGGDAEAYAESLLSTCRFCIESPLACVAGVTGADLKERVLGIVTGRALVRMSWPKRLLLAGAAVCVVAAPVVLGQAKAARQIADAMLKAAPTPLRRLTHTMIAEEETPSTGEIAEAEPPASMTAVPVHHLGAIGVPQADAPLQITGFGTSTSDEFDGGRVDSRIDKPIMFFRMGWAYVLPTGLEFHVGDTIVPYNEMPPHGTYGLPEQHATFRPDALGFLYFIEQVAQDNGTNWYADHKQIEAYARQVQAHYAAQSNAASNGAAAAAPSFEVASIRMVDSHTAAELQRGIGLAEISTYPTTHFYARYVPLDFLIGIAYGLDEAYIQKDAGWMDEQLYDVEATVPGNKPLSKEEMKPLLQNLLAQRFHLALHPVSKTVSGFDLVVVKGGPKVQSAKAGEEIHAQILPNEIDAQSASMNLLASILMRPAGQPVVDKTGLSGAYDVRLRFAPANDPKSNLPSLFTAIQEQLGLRLEPAKVPVEYLVIDHADRIPTPN
ncbi:MAG TPA: TIGR03435 family protein [Acidobacteriaceae bacterium]|nr:TIGR03435 family protein [Acidobacteriaceae bacterium]